MSLRVDAASCFVVPVDLGVTKTGPATVAAGGAVSYTIQVTNNGPNPSSGWTLTDPIPAGLTNAATTTDGRSITAGSLSCTGGALAVGALVPITLTGNATADATTIVNTATVHGNDPDPNPDNDTSTFTTNVVRSVDLAVVKTGPATVAPGGEITYTIEITNNGPQDSTGWTLTDTIPAQVTGAPTSTPGCGIGQTATITFSLTTEERSFGDLKLDNTVVSDTPGNNCPRAGTDPRCTTHGTVKARDKDSPRAARLS